jgi:NAD(P)H-dependent flavin oxidoreductase YrpB (nitropropane dioxygenase family)
MVSGALKELKIGDLTARLPIIQGGMGVCISLSGLASAVANEGGIGVIACAVIGMMEPGYFTNLAEADIKVLRNEIRKARKLTKGILGVNIMVALSNYEKLVKTAIEEGIDIIFSGGGLPLDLPKYLNGSKTKLVPIVSSARAAGLISRRWMDKYNHVPDAVVVEGPLAGGHLGFKLEQIEDPNFILEKLVPEVIEEMKKYDGKCSHHIPVIAAGGIYTGADIHKFIDELGADGVQMATRFVTTEECDASINFKNAYINAKKEDVVIIKSPVGMPGRAIKNTFIEDVNKGNKKPFKCPYHCIKTCDVVNAPYCIGLALISAQKGNLKDGFAFSGANVYKTDKIITVKQLVHNLLEEYKQAAAGTIK